MRFDDRMCLLIACASSGVPLHVAAPLAQDMCGTTTALTSIFSSRRSLFRPTSARRRQFGFLEQRCRRDINRISQSDQRGDRDVLRAALDSLVVAKVESDTLDHLLLCEARAQARSTKIRSNRAQNRRDARRQHRRHGGALALDL